MTATIFPTFRFVAVVACLAAVADGFADVVAADGAPLL